MFFWSHPRRFGPLGKFQHNIKISIKTARVSRLSVSYDYDFIIKGSCDLVDKTFWRDEQMRFAEPYFWWVEIRWGVFGWLGVYEIILCGWGLVGKYSGWEGMNGGEWCIILGGLGWVRKYFGCAQVGAGEWGWVGVSTLFDNACFILWLKFSIHTFVLVLE